MSILHAFLRLRFFTVKLSCHLLLCLSLLSTQLIAQENWYEKESKQAEKHYREQSYTLAREAYLELAKKELTLEQRRWVDFRLADTLWRLEAASGTAANADQILEGRKALERLLDKYSPEPDRNSSLWAMIHESLADVFWKIPGSQDWGRAWEHYQKALEWWAASTDLEESRAHYLAIVLKIIEDMSQGVGNFYNNPVPIELIDNALKIVQNHEICARLHFIQAMKLKMSSDWRYLERVPEEFEACLRLGTTTSWYDDALFQYANWLENDGRAEQNEQGQWFQKRDYKTALHYYKQLLKEFKHGDSRYANAAQDRVSRITEHHFDVLVGNVFLPNSKIEFELDWRNISAVEFSLYQASLIEDIKFPGSEKTPTEWIDALELPWGKEIKSWSEKLGEAGDYQPNLTKHQLGEALTPGAYLLEARAQGQSRRDLILVSDAALLAKTLGHQIVTFFCNALDGTPIPDADVVLWIMRDKGNQYLWEQFSAKTDFQGLAKFSLSTYSRYFLAAKQADRQAFAAGNQLPSDTNTQPSWKIYAFTDRPAYRPGENVQWKLVARKMQHAIYSTPQGKSIYYQIDSPHGKSISDGNLTLNSFGSAWSVISLPPPLPLGVYTAVFKEAKSGPEIGRATLFRVEEYELPEFKVQVTAPKLNGKKRTFQPGDTVDAEILVEYYAGGAAQGAEVEVLVHRRPFLKTWESGHSWFYGDSNSDNAKPGLWGNNYGPEQISEHLFLTTDEQGKAIASFKTAGDWGADCEYTVEARVRDLSRREAVNAVSIRVTQPPYYIKLTPEKKLYDPKEEVSYDIYIVDANDQPIETEGKLRFVKKEWLEIWETPDRREVSGEELLKSKATFPIFPPLPRQPDAPRWKLIKKGYQNEVIDAKTIKTDSAGKARYRNTPGQVGFYELEWESANTGRTPVNETSAIWVIDRTTNHLGYHADGVELIVDKNSFQEDENATVMIASSAKDRHVLVNIEGEEIYDTMILSIEGTVRLLELPLKEHLAPNFFVSALLVSDANLYAASREISVLPSKNFLEVTIETPKQEFMPREKGQYKIFTRNSAGQPVSAELSLAVVDQAISSIQWDFAEDPRKFFFDTRRNKLAVDSSTFSWKSYAIFTDKEKSPSAQELSEIENATPLEEPKLIGAPSEVANPADSLNPPLQAAQSPGLMAHEPPAETNMVYVRNDFLPSLFWKPDLQTNESGEAVVEIDYGDSLTSWEATARAATTSNQFGIGRTLTRTSQPLIARLQTPHFFIVGDEATLSATLQNNTKHELACEALLSMDKPLEILASPKSNAVQVPPNSQVRLDWRVAAKTPGPALIQLIAQSDKLSDAVERTCPVNEHGIQQVVIATGKTVKGEATLQLNLPKERRSTTLTAHISPSLVGTLLSALPYLIEFPYSSTEQTVSRFLPTLATAKTLADYGLDATAIQAKCFSTPTPSPSAEKSQDSELDEIKKLTKSSLQQLYDFQRSDGSWGWWKDAPQDHWMTAYALWGLTSAKKSGEAVRQEALAHGIDFLEANLTKEEENLELQAWMLHAASSAAKIEGRAVGKPQMLALDNLWQKRKQLSTSGKALLALSAHSLGNEKAAKTLIDNLKDSVVLDGTLPSASSEAQPKSDGPEIPPTQPLGTTAHWGQSEKPFQYWFNEPVESTAFALNALLEIDPKHELVEPAALWLVKNRQGPHWNNTRDTAIAILALNNYLKEHRELEQEIGYEFSVNKKSIAIQPAASARELLASSGDFSIPSELLKDGTNVISLKTTQGQGSLYLAAEAQFFAKQEPIQAAGEEFLLQRQYSYLAPQPTLLKGYTFKKCPLTEKQTLAANTRVEVRLLLELKSDGEYLVLEDHKPAGFEAIDVQSGQQAFAKQLKPEIDQTVSQKDELQEADYTGLTRWIYSEPHDDKTVFFIDKLTQGTWEIRYTLYAKTPGKFHALPAQVQAVYRPDLKANSSEGKISINN